MQERWPDEWQNIEYHGVVAKVPKCPDMTLTTPLPQQSSSSVDENRRRRSAAFANVAKEMIIYLETSEELKVVSRKCKNNWRYLYK